MLEADLDSVKEAIYTASEALRGLRHVVVLTGAGISVESGIPDFRSAGGLWQKFDPFEYATSWAFSKDPEKCWSLFRELGETITSAKPNAAHKAVSTWEKGLDRLTVVTQNIDGLHQLAGSSSVVEFHGDVRSWTCIHCGEKCQYFMSHS